MATYPSTEAGYNNFADDFSVLSDVNKVYAVDPKLFLDSYINRGMLGFPESVEDVYFEDPRPSFDVDPSKLDLREFRRPGAPVDPREFLDRDQFLLLSPRSPLT